jgi:hypothetical protein
VALNESHDLRRRHRQVASGLAAHGIAIRVRSALGGQRSAVKSDLPYLVADPQPQHTFKHIPRLVVGVMNVERRDPLVP